MTRLHIQKIESLINRFINENGREPKACDFDSTSYLPSARSIQRRWGGLQLLRKELNLSVINHGIGKLRGKTMMESMKRSKQYENELHNLLFLKHHDPQKFSISVERELEYHQYAEMDYNLPAIRSDSALVDRVNHKVTCIDYFYPRDKASLQSCVRNKRKKFEDSRIKFISNSFENIFVCVNPEFSQESLDNMNITRGNYTLLSLDTFKAKFL